MPTYQYACTNPEGKHEFEVVQSFTDAPVSECPECGAPVRKVYGSVGVVFKGSGFYRTDSRAGAGSTVAKSESGSDSSSSTSTETKTEKKADTKATPAAKPSTPAAAAS